MALQCWLFHANSSIGVKWATGIDTLTYWLTYYIYWSINIIYGDGYFHSKWVFRIILIERELEISAAHSSYKISGVCENKSSTAVILFWLLIEEENKHFAAYISGYIEASTTIEDMSAHEISGRISEQS